MSTAHPPASDDLPENAIEISGLSKTYAGKTPKHALKSVDLNIPRGSFFALLGPNGAGKSTLINILAGLVLKSAGDVRIWGHDIAAARKAASQSIGIVPQELNLDPFFTARESLEQQAGFFGIPPGRRRTAEILDAIGLTDKANASSRSLSGGMRRRLLVGKALVHSPPILVLDEPTAGVDIELRQTLWKYVKRLNEQGVTIVLTTHYLEEAEQLCDRIAIINHGRVIANDTTGAILSQLDSKTVTFSTAETLTAVPAELAGFSAELLGPSKMKVHYKPSDTAVARILAAVQQAGLTINDISTEEADLEDIFLQLTRTDGAA